MTAKKSTALLSINPNFSACVSALGLEGTVATAQRRFVLGQDLAKILAELPVEFRSSDFFRVAKKELGHLEKKELAASLRNLQDSEIVISAESRRKIEREKKVWFEHGWGPAWEYFSYIKNYPFLDYGSADSEQADQELMEEYYQGFRPPSPYKDYQGKPRVRLRKNWSAFQDVTALSSLSVPQERNRQVGISLGTLGPFLHFAFGEMGSVSFISQGKFLLKTSPSGGARHPTEAYCLIRRGAYYEIFHYSVRHHALEDLGAKVSLAEIREILYGGSGEGLFQPRFILVLTSVLKRSMWRYREPRSYRVALHDVGHLVETVRMLGIAQGWDVYSCAGFDDQRLHRLLKLRSQSEVVLGFVTLDS